MFILVSRASGQNCSFARISKKKGVDIYTPYYSQNTVAKAKQMDLLTYLQRYEPNELVRISANTYSTRTHDSLKISNGKWMWWSRGVGGENAIDYLMIVRGMTFIEAVSQIANDESALKTQYERPPPKAERHLILPTKAENNDIAIEYLKKRGINENVISYFIEKGMLYQSVPMNNIVFVGFDENDEPKYAGMRGTEKYRYIGDAYGSDKAFPFRLVNKENTNIHIFEGAIDLLSYATLLYEQDPLVKGFFVPNTPREEMIPMSIFACAAFVIVAISLNVSAAIRVERLKKKGLIKCEADPLW